MSTEPETHSREGRTRQNYSEKAIELTATFDRLMISIYSALIAGIIVLLLKEEVSAWIGASLILALICFILGIGHTLLHLAFMSKMLFLIDAISNETNLVPDAIGNDEPTERAYARNQAYAHTSYTSQLLYMLSGISFGSIAVIIRLWDYAWRAGVISTTVIAILFAVVTTTITWKKTLRRFRPSLPQ